jgi:outer membrane lipoprotein SlyB
VLATLLVTGCHSSSSTYDSGDVGRTVETAPGTVVSSRVVQVTGESNAVGAGAGGALGAATGGLVFESGWAAVIGGVLGAGVGYATQQAANSREGIEYVVTMNDGRTVTLVQNRASGEMPIANGTPVLVQLGGKYSRVMPDPRGQQPASSGGWVDPDKVTTGGAPSGAPPSSETGARPRAQ